MARRVARQPLAEQLGHRVNAARGGRIGLRIRRVALAVKDEVGAVMNEYGARVAGRARQRRHRQRVHLERRLRMILGGIDIVEPRAVDDAVGTLALDGPRDRGVICQIEPAARERDDGVPGAEFAHGGAAKLSGGAGDEDLHRSRAAVALLIGTW